MLRNDVSPWIVRGLYLFALVLVLSPVLDLVSTVWPLRPTDLAWRYGFLGLGAGYLHTPILGLVLALLVGWWTGSPGVLRVLGVVMMGGSLVLMLVMGMFILDVLQMRGLREPNVQQAVLVGGVLQEVKYGTACLVLAALGFGSLRSASARAGARGSAGDRARRPGIVTAR